MYISSRKKVFEKIKKNRLPILLLLAGCFLISLPLLYKPHGASKPSSPIHIDAKLLQKKDSAAPPIGILIPGLSVDLPIKESKVINGYWEVADSTANHGEGSASPGENGNIVIFAHAKPNLFAPLRDIKKGDTIYILTNDKWYRYSVKETKLVDPSQTEVIKPTTSEVLTLYTCSGFLDSKRLIVKAR